MHTKLIPRPDVRGVTVYSEDDVEPILDRNKELRSQPQHSDWGRHVATIPLVILQRWLDEEWSRGRRGLRLFTKEWDELVTRKLQDPDWKFLRTDK